MPFLRNTVQLVAWSSIALVPFIFIVFGARATIGFASGTLWAMANMWAITKLTCATITSSRPSKWRLVFLWVLKMPLLYIVAALLIISPWSSPIGFLAGFSFWFLSLVISALRAAA